ncbi:AfsR/SARP family transcriptional regulator [Actinocrispum wychmicini]|uniref:DNA-binding SARP family transcriptional activator n=1 Tax=Actinocrispum wychmicini TaxID=1213861 RepID=A0A4R2K3H9_9PSEU|nr:AfsR/SARP family transcriptional regulator [Actinocrispum wychmicini]TCO60875.1 DNA-binding SARP family transcriptional activator [Actinocrispum wychmicini]
MRIKVLGPMEVSRDEHLITPTATKHRQLLALLALNAGQVVSVRTLFEELWGSEPPNTADQTLRTYILHLRRRIGRQAKEVLVTRHGGYQLDLAAGDLDTQVYERLATEGRLANDQGRTEAASRLLRSALEVWRGPALVDVHVGLPMSVHVNRLDESKLGVLEAWIDTDLRLGRHQLLLSELAELTARFPMHERLCGQYMIAQYRSGRQWRALEIFRTLRHNLVAELGVEPSAGMQHLQRAILNADPRLNDPITVVASAW